MIITISGRAGSGKSTIAKELAKRLDLKHYSVGDVMRQMAKEKDMTLIELNRLAEKDDKIDKELDDRLIRLGKEEDDFIIDGRLTAHFIPHADHRIFLEAEKKTRAERILKAQRRDETNQNIEQTMTNMDARESSEKKRYLRYYGIDYTDPKLYTNVIDTTTLDIEEVVSTILGLIRKE